jgi:hypothetical protein
MASSKSTNEQRADARSPVSTLMINSLSYMRLGMGTAFLIAPSQVASLLQVTVLPNSVLFVRLFAIRDLLFGQQLYTAESQTQPDGGKREIKRALWAGIMADAVDMCSIAIAYSSGTLSAFPASLLMSGAVSGIGMGFLGLNGM